VKRDAAIAATATTHGEAGFVDKVQTLYGLPEKAPETNTGRETSTTPVPVRDGVRPEPPKRRSRRCGRGRCQS
jgi:hypothetical protein